MGLADTVTKAYMKDNSVFADKSDAIARRTLQNAKKEA